MLKDFSSVLLQCLTEGKQIGESLHLLMPYFKAKHYFLVRYNSDKTQAFIVSSDIENQSDINDNHFVLNNSADYFRIKLNSGIKLFLDLENDSPFSSNNEPVEQSLKLFITVMNKIIEQYEYDIPYLLKRTQNFSEDKIKKQISRSFSVISLSSDYLFEHLVSLFYRSKVFENFDIDYIDLVSFLIEIRKRYNNAPYHNWVHAVDVTQFVATIIENVGITNYIEQYEAFAVLFAAICHDIDHTGHNNAFHRKATTIYATLARSILPPLESHHAELAMQILHEGHNHIFQNIKEKEKIEHIVVDCILATDMEKNNEFVNKFKDVMTKYDRNNENDRLLLCQIILKAADLSNTVRDFDEAVKMTQQLMTEFFQQGDLESKLGIEISPMCDRNTAGPISKGQIGFYKFVAQPLMRSLNNFFPNLEENEKQFHNNLQQWESMNDE